MKKKPSPKAHKKPVASVKPPFAVVTPAKPEKPAEGIPASGPEPVTTRRLLDFFEDLAGRLEKFFEEHPESLDEKPINQIHVAMTACHDILAKKAAKGGGVAFVSLARQISGGCKTLHDLSCAVDGVEEVAATYPE